MKTLFDEEWKQDDVKKFKIDIISRFYPFTNVEVLKYKSILNFDRYHLMDNPNIQWDIDLLSALQEKIDWTGIWKLSTMKIDSAFVKRFADHVDLRAIQLSKNIEWDDELIEICSKEDWTKAVINFKGISTISILRKYCDKVDWHFVSNSFKLDFTDELIDEFIEQWDWKVLSSNRRLPISVNFIQKYAEKLDFARLSLNPASLPLIYQYPNSPRWNWDLVIINRGITYDQESFDFLFPHYERHLNFRWKRILPVKLNALGSFIHQVFSGSLGDLNFFLMEDFLKYIPWDVFSKRCNTKLTMDFITQNIDKLNFKEGELLRCIRESITMEFVRGNHSLFDKNSYRFYDLPLSKDILYDFPTEINWNYLSGCETLDWDWNFIVENFDNFKLFKLSTNRSIYQQLFECQIEKEDFLAILDN